MAPPAQLPHDIEMPINEDDPHNRDRKIMCIEPATPARQLPLAGKPKKKKKAKPVRPPKRFMFIGDDEPLDPQEPPSPAHVAPPNISPPEQHQLQGQDAPHTSSPTSSQPPSPEVGEPSTPTQIRRKSLP